MKQPQVFIHCQGYPGYFLEPIEINEDPGNIQGNMTCMIIIWTSQPQFLVYIEVGTQWLTFCRQHFQMHFLEKKIVPFDFKFVPADQSNDKSALAQVCSCGSK